MKAIKLFLMLWLVALSCMAKAAIVYIDSSTIKEVWTWAVGGVYANDAVILIDTGLLQCPSGVFIKDITSSQGAYSSSLLAYSSKSNVKMTVFDDVFWGGSGTPYCKVRAIFLK